MFGYVWMLLNSALIALLIVLLYKAAKLLWQHIGAWASIAFVFLLLSFTSAPAPKAPAKPNVTLYPGVEELENPMLTQKDHKMLILDDRGPFNILLGFYFGYSERAKLAVPTNAFTAVEGLMGSQKWTPLNISLATSGNGDQVTYTVDGTIEWKLLNSVVYTQYKSYTGTIKVR